MDQSHLLGFEVEVRHRCCVAHLFQQWWVADKLLLAALCSVCKQCITYSVTSSSVPFLHVLSMWCLSHLSYCCLSLKRYQIMLSCLRAQLYSYQNNECSWAFWYHCIVWHHFLQSSLLTPHHCLTSLSKQTSMIKISYDQGALQSNNIWLHQPTNTVITIYSDTDTCLVESG